MVLAPPVNTNSTVNFWLLEMKVVSAITKSSFVAENQCGNGCKSVFEHMLQMMSTICEIQMILGGHSPFLMMMSDRWKGYIKRGGLVRGMLSLTPIVFNQT